MSNVGTNQTSSAHAYFLVFGLGIRPRNVSCMCFMDSVHTISSQHSTRTLLFVNPRTGVFTRDSISSAALSTAALSTAHEVSSRTPPPPPPVHRVCADEKKKDPSSADAVVADNAPAATAAPGTVEPVVTGLASGSMTVAVPRSMTASLPSFLRLLASHADATYSDAGTLVKEWGISNSTLEVS